MPLRPKRIKSMTSLIDDTCKDIQYDIIHISGVQNIGINNRGKPCRSSSREKVKPLNLHEESISYYHTCHKGQKSFMTSINI